MSAWFVFGPAPAGGFYIGLGWIIAWLVAGCATTGWAWHVDDEETWWAAQLNDLRLVYELRPLLALLLALVIVGFFVALVGSTIAVWPAELVRHTVKAWARRRQRRALQAFS